MLDKRYLKRFLIISLLLLFVLTLSFGLTSCQFGNKDDNKEEITFENIIFMDGDQNITPSRHPNPNDFVPEKEGHTFRYWTIKKNNVFTIFKTENYDGEPITLYASWKVDEYTVRFVDKDGVTIKVDDKEEQKVKYASSAIAPNPPQIAGYTFIGWDKSFDEVKENMVITAKYENADRKVTFVFEDDILAEKVFKIGEKITNLEKDALSSLSSYTSHGLVFESWYSDENLNNKVNIADIIVSENLTIYAKLIPAPIEKLNLSTKVQDNTFLYKEDLIVTINCSYTSYNSLSYDIVWLIDDTKLDNEKGNRVSLSNLTFGNHTIKVEVSATFNGLTEKATETLILTIARETLTVKANDVSIVYGDQIPQFTYTVKSNKGYDFGKATFECDYAVGCAVGKYSIKIANLSNDIYKLEIEEGTLTVVPKEITVKADDLTLTYGDPIPDFTYTATGLLFGDILSGGKFSCSYAKGSRVDEYTITLDGLVNDNYKITKYTDGTLTVRKMELQIKIEYKNTVYYGDPKPTFEYKILKGELIEGDDLIPTYTCIYEKGADATRYRVDIKFNVHNNYDIQNYDIRTSVGWLTVYPREVSVDWNFADNYIYNGLEQSETISATYTDINGNAETIELSYEKEGIETAFQNAGSYTLTATTTNANYKLLNNVKSLTINKCPIIIKVNDTTITYGDEIPEYSFTALGAVENDTLGKVLFDCAYVKGSKVGTYQLKANGLDNPNYEVSYENAMLTVIKRTVSVDWSISSTYVYNGKIQSDTIHALFKKYDGKNTVMTLTYYLDDKVSIFKNAGNYRVVASTDESNYELINAENTITINPKPLVLTLENKTITYGEQAPAYSFHTEGLVNGEIDLTLGKVEYICSYAQGNDAGNYEIKCKALLTQNYLITYVNGTLTVNKMTVDAIWSFLDNYTYNGRSQSDTVSVKFRGYTGDYLPMNVSFISGESKDFYHAGEYIVSANSEDERNYIVNHKERVLTIAKKRAVLTADSQTVTYGDSVPNYTYVASGLAGEDSFGELSYSCNYARGSSVDDYPIEINHFESNDYALTFVNAILTVTKRVVDVNWTNLETYTYNKNDQSESVVAKFIGYTGEIEKADLTFNLNGRENQFINAGQYSIIATHSNANYTLTNNTKELTINKKSADVVLNSFDIIYGEEAPKYSYEIIGLESGDTLIGVSFACSYAKGSNVGNYEINGNFEEQENYVLNVTNSMLTVSPLEVNIIWNNRVLTYNGLSQENEFTAIFMTYTGVEQNLNLLFIQNEAPVEFKNAGDYLVKVDYQNENYILNDTEKSATILPKALGVVLENKNTIFGDSVEYTHVINGLVPNESESVLGNINYICDYVVGLPVGEYQISANGFVNSNYNITYSNANLSVAVREVEAEWTINSNYVYNGFDQSDTILATYLSYTGEKVIMDISITNGNPIFKNAGNYEFSASFSDSNYSVTMLTKNLVINKANYNNITHKTLSGTYNPDFTLSNYALEQGFSWVTPYIVPIVKTTSYKAVYNEDSENYNDYNLTVKVILSKADYSNITHKALSGTYKEDKTLSAYTLEKGFTWADKTTVPVVNNTSYPAIYNIDKDNYNDFNLNIELKLEKASYTSITHKAFSGTYSPTLHLSNYALDTGFAWFDKNIIPTVDVTEYKAIYNLDSDNYNDYEIMISLKLKKASFQGNITHDALSGSFDPNKTLNDYILDDGFKWSNTSTVPSAKTDRYLAIYNTDPINYNNKFVYITLTISTVDYTGTIPTHPEITATYDPSKKLSDYNLEDGFRWVDPTFAPTLGTQEYEVYYNPNIYGYNDIKTTVVLTVTKNETNENATKE